MIGSVDHPRRQTSPRATGRCTHALSFDVEEYFHVHAFSGVISRSDWDSLPSRVVPSTRRILDLLHRFQTKATFFVLGWVAKRHPELVREIADQGHEIASHGHEHQAVYSLTREEFSRDLQRAGEAILDACPSAEIKGYRAPSFSINESTPWAFDELRALGFVYDSSISPATLHDRYGVQGAPRMAHRSACNFLEIPPSTIRLWGHNFPVAGGGHFRFAPLAFSKWAIRRIEKEGHPVVSYLHPWEFDPGQPRIKKAGLKSRFRHYVNIRKTEGRLAKLLAEFKFDRMDVVFRDHLARGCDPYSSALAQEIG